jgi:signal peptidase I
MPGDLIVDRPPTGHYRPGQVLTFRHSDLTTDVVTHRVTAVTPSGLIHTKGDANRTADVWQIRPDQVQGSVMFRVKALGYVLVFLRQPTGAAATLALVVALVLLWQLFFAGTGREVTDPDPSADKGESLPDLDIPERVARR